MVTGIAGVAGYNAFHFFRRRYGDAVVGVRQPSMWPLSGPGIVACDLTDPDEVRGLWHRYRFQSLISSLGSCRLKSCELDPAMAHRVNVVGTDHVLRQASEFGARVIHTSIDLVFGGRESDEVFSGYVETDTPDPVTVYGTKMVEAERLVLQHCRAACILRISLPMGVSFNGHAGAIDWIASRFKQNKPATLYFDEIRTPTYTDCLCRLMHRLMANPAPGVFHAGGPRALSLYQIAQIVNMVGGYDPELLCGCPRAEAGPMPPRAGNVTLSSEKLINTVGDQPFAPWPALASLVPTDRQWHFQRDADAFGRATNGLSPGPQAITRLLYQNPLAPEPVPVIEP